MGTADDLQLPTPEHTRFVAINDPAAALARIDGDRAVLAEYERAVDLYDRDSDAPDGVAALETAVRALAYGYRHRAGWQEGWAP